MASPLEVEGVTPTMQSLVTHVYRFPLPATRHIDFEAAFERALGAEETKGIICSMNQARRDLATELATATPNYQNAVAAAKRYVPLIAQTLSSLEQASFNSQKVFLSKALEFSWTTGIGSTPRTKWVSNQAVVWDKSMAIASQAISLSVIVYNIVEDGDVANKYAEAGAYLREAAGIMEHLHKEELPRWIGETAKQPRPPEAIEGICEGLVPFLLAEAQQMAVAKAMSTGKTPPTLLAKLCLGVCSLLDSSIATMRTKGGIGYANLDPAFLQHISFVQNLFKALAHRFMAVHHWQKEEYGKGIAFLRASFKFFNERSDCTSLGMPKLIGPHFQAVSGKMNTLRAEVGELYKAYNGDNSNIYYDAITPEDELEMPQPAIMMKPTCVEEPAAPKTLVFLDTEDTPKVAVGDTAGAPPAEGERRTDEQLAKELHEKLNNS